MKLCNYCFKQIPNGYDIWWNQKPYHPDCAIQVAVTETREDEMKEKTTNVERNCNYCKQHILATTQVIWKGAMYHELCLAHAIQEAHQPPKQEVQEDFDGEDFFAEDYEDYTEEEAMVNGNGHVVIPEVMPKQEVHINDVVGQASATYVAERNSKSNGNLMLGAKGSRFVTRTDLYDLETPQATSTWQPVPHYDFVRKLLDGLWDRRMIVTDEKYAVSQDGYKLYGLLTLQDEYNGVNYAIGLKNSNDKSTRLSLAVGYVVKVCTNGMINGDYQPLTAKHSKNFNLEDSLCIGIDRIKRGFLKLNGNIERKRDFLLTEGIAQEFIYKAFMKYKLPISLLNTVHKEMFVAPSYEEFKPLNLWSLENSFTTAFKKLQPTSQFEAVSKLAKFIDHCLS